MTRYRAFQPPDTLGFSAEELAFVDWWIVFIDKHTATSISQLSHDYSWEIASMGEELPLYAFLASKDLRTSNRGRDQMGERRSELPWP